MRKTVLFIGYLAVALVGANLHASIISGPQTTSGGKVVDLGGLEWLNWTETLNMSRIDVNAQLGSGGSLEGWRYASRAEVGALLDSLWGGTNEGLHVSNLDGVNWLSANLGDAYFNLGESYARTDFVFGADDEVTSSNAFLGSYYHNVSATEGYFADEHGLTTGVDATDTQNLYSTAAYGNYIGHALVRNAEVPEPSTYVVFAGLITCFGVAGWWPRRKAA